MTNTNEGLCVRSGGKLWNHLKKFLKHSSASHQNRGSKSSSTYEGQRLIFESDKLSEEGGMLPSHQESEISEADQSFRTDLAVAECKSSMETYSVPCKVDGTHYQSSLSNIIDFPHNRGTEQLGIDRLSVPSYSQSKHSFSQVKSRSLDDINSSKDDVNQAKSLIESGDWKGSNINNKDLNKVECRSIGSDTLSGVSDDFSYTSFNPLPDLENAEHLGADDRAEPTYSFSVTRNKDLSSTFDVNSLIKNSKKLIEDVNKTLEQSKRQIIQTFSSREFTNPEAPSDSKSEPLDKSKFASRRKNPFPEEVFAAHPSRFQKDEPSAWKGELNLTEFSTNRDQETVLFSNKEPPSKESLHLETADEARCFTLSQPIPSKLMSTSSIIESFPRSREEENGQIPEGLVRVWVSQVISAMDHLHQQEIIWG